MNVWKLARAWLWVMLVLVFGVESGVGEAFIVQDCQPGAEIVIAGNPPRTVKLAALELQAYLKKISGAELPILTNTVTPGTVKLYVGRSGYTDQLGVTDVGLKSEAFRMKSGPDYLVLLGQDRDFAPKSPWAKNNGDIPRAQAEWDKLTGASWTLPLASIYKHYNQTTGLWLDDEGGSLNAVYEFLRTLGVRWYMPGKLGEVVPQLKTIPLSQVDRIVQPDFRYRVQDYGNYSRYTWDDLIWARRLGLNNETMDGPHGMARVHGRTEMQAAHPDYYALVGGKRDTEYRGTGHACFSSEGLFAETVRYARAVFDHYDLPAISIMPQDGYHHCQCERCKDQAPSDLVWGFVNRVAIELYETHPDRFVVGGAYTAYRDPPAGIDGFSSNLVVRISWHRTNFDVTEAWQAYWDLVENWRVKLAPQRLMRNDNNLYTSTSDAATPVIFPIIFTRSIARDLRALKGISLGDRESVPRSPDQYWQHPGANHLNIYVLSRYLWDAGLDLDALLDEYFTLFYGPARGEMRTAFEFAEATCPRDGPATPSRVPLSDRIRFVEMLHRARAAAADTVYGQRIQLIMDEMQPLETLRALHAAAEARGEVPEFTSMHDMAGTDKWLEASRTFVLDGKLDEPFWTAYHHGAALKEINDGKRPRYLARFYLKWFKDALYFGIRCDDPNMANLTIPTQTNQNPALRSGDCVTLLLETDVHSYYEITINPAGAVWDADCSENGAGEAWSSQAEVATHIGDDYWSIEARIPVMKQDDDPLHALIGRMPSRSFPWHFNVVRRRARDSDVECSAWVPTGSADFHDKLKFGKLSARHTK